MAEKFSPISELNAPQNEPIQFRTYSTSLSVPFRIKKELQRNFGVETREYYRSLSIYQRVAAQAIKNLCQAANEQCASFGAAVFSEYLKESYATGKFGYVALRKLTGSSAKLMESVHYTLHNNSIQTLTVVQKLDDFKNWLTQAEFQYITAGYLLTGFIPLHGRQYLARKWGGSPRWVRDLAFGWRRKLDSSLPSRFRMNQVPSATERLKERLFTGLKHPADFASFPHIEKIVGRLQKLHLLHLLMIPGVKFDGILAAAYISEASSLNTFFSSLVKDKKWGAEFYPDHLSLTKEEFEAAAKIELGRAEQVLQLLSSRGRNTVKMKAFHSAVQLLLDHIGLFTGYLELILPSARHLRALAKLISAIIPGRRRRLVASFAAIIARACAEKYKDAPVKLIGQLVPEQLITAPFSSVKRKKKEIPLELVMNKEFVIYRQDNYHNMATGLVDLIKRRAGKKVHGEYPTMPFVIPKREVKTAMQELNSPSQDRISLVILKNHYMSHLFKNNLLLEAKLSHRMIEVLTNGAQINHSRLRPPSGPSHKLIMDLVFSGVQKCFVPTFQFLDAGNKHKHESNDAFLDRKPKGTDRKPPSKDSVLGTDRNRVGVHALYFATPEHVLDTGAELEQVHTLGKKLKVVRKELPHIARKIAVTEQALARCKNRHRKKMLQEKLGRLQVEQTLVHRRKSNLKDTHDLECSLGGARVLLNNRAGALAVEELELSPQDTRGGLAVAITDMPKKADIVERMVSYAAGYHDLKNTQNGQNQVQLVPVDPRGTSQYHADCGAKLQKLPGNYDVMWCPKCKKEVIRHASSAQIIAKRGYMKIKGIDDTRIPNTIKDSNKNQSLNLVS